MVDKIIQNLSQNQFPLQTEKILQAAISDKFTEEGIAFSREYKLDKDNVPDFFIGGIAIEVKIKGNAKAIYKQCVRYCGFDEVKCLILATNRSIGFPKEINGKPCFVVNLGRAWL